MAAASPAIQQFRVLLSLSFDITAAAFAPALAVCSRTAV
jgi:hypothetical protein